jgi:hypothetical protein
MQAMVFSQLLAWLFSSCVAPLAPKNDYPVDVAPATIMSHAGIDINDESGKI